MIEMTIRKTAKGLLRISSSNHIRFQKRDEQASGASPYLSYYSRDCGPDAVMVPMLEYQAITIVAFIDECQKNKLPFTVDFPSSNVILGDGAEFACLLALSEPEVKKLYEGIEAEYSQMLENKRAQQFSRFY